MIANGLRFDPFFRDYGMLEDAHFSLRAAGEWELLQCGDARCVELHSPNGRVDRRRVGYKCVVNTTTSSGRRAASDVASPDALLAYQAFELLGSLSRRFAAIAGLTDGAQRAAGRVHGRRAWHESLG